MHKYYDRDTCKRIRFVQNIPYFRKMDQAILYKISYLLIEDRNIQIGDLILQQGIHSENIMIVMEGQVQVRSSDYWIGNLNKGSCFNVYRPFNKDKPAKINYYSNSENCQIVFLPINDLVSLCISDP